MRFAPFADLDPQRVCSVVCTAVSQTVVCRRDQTITFHQLLGEIFTRIRSELFQQSPYLFKNFETALASSDSRWRFIWNAVAHELEKHDMKNPSLTTMLKLTSPEEGPEQDLLQLRLTFSSLTQAVTELEKINQQSDRLMKQVQDIHQQLSV